MDVKVSIHGAREIEKVLQMLPDRVAKKVIEGAVRQGANVIRAEARRRAPVRAEPGVKKRSKSRGTLPGFLKASISVKKIKQSPALVHLAVSVGRAFWGMFYEFGTRHQPARPFMRPAFDSAGGRALQKIGEWLGKGIDKEAAKLAREVGAVRRR
jgi:HK97 gp10 family phage protein